MHKGLSASEFDALCSVMSKMGESVEEIGKYELSGILRSLAVRASQVTGPSDAEAYACYLVDGRPRLTLSHRVDHIGDGVRHLFILGSRCTYLLCNLVQR